MDKKERRSAVFELIPGSKVALLMVFRGGWIDAISSSPSDDVESLEAWLIKSRYMEEIHTISFGVCISSLLGNRKPVLEDRLRGLGKRVWSVPKRNAEQARIILDGISEYLSSGKPGKCAD